MTKEAVGDLAGEENKEQKRGFVSREGTAAECKGVD